MSITLSAYAKVNLTLEVLGKRDDGYHEIASVLQTISLADTLRFDEAESLDLHCTDTSVASADNLVLKAADIMREMTGCRMGATVHLTKRIPIAAGLGSGATDAAATLVGLNMLWALKLPDERLAELAAALGSDVAAFLVGGTVLAKGRGEMATPLASTPQVWMVLVKPAIDPGEGKTAKMYARLDSSHFTSGQYTDRLVARIREGERPDRTRLFNVFEEVAFDFFPGLAEYRSQLLQAGAGSVQLAGAGPALYAPVSDRVEGEAIVNNLKESGTESYLVSTVASSARPSVGDVS
jgi:4-diphosphocytidyl-2-C-methyl-D-erythritol kinase